MRVTAPGPSEARRLMDSGPSGYGDGKGFAQAATQALIENAPGADIATAVRDSYTLGQAIGPALRDGRYAEAMQSFMESTAAALSALPMVPALAGVIKAYHGTPHQFEQFSMDKIGTGEGAQAYGHGLYFAENEKVASGYKSAGASGHLNATNARIAQDAYDEAAKSSDDVYRGAREILWGKYSSETDAFKKRQLQDAYNNVTELAGPQGAKAGALYHVNLDVDHDELLDWDLPLSQQSPKVQEALGKLGVPEAATGREIYEKLAHQQTRASMERGYVGGGVHAADGQRDAARVLREAGVPGIRYLDAGSRGSGEGSRNIVLFSDDKIKIEKRQ